VIVTLAHATDSAAPRVALTIDIDCDGRICCIDVVLATAKLSALR
jgi:uncharacterized protein YuzE